MEWRCCHHRNFGDALLLDYFLDRVYIITSMPCFDYSCSSIYQMQHFARTSVASTTVLSSTSGLFTLFIGVLLGQDSINAAKVSLWSASSIPPMLGGSNPRARSNWMMTI